jgi:hypothetical protein
MIDNPNPNNFYSKIEMIERENYIPKIKSVLLDNLRDIISKIENEDPFPHGNISIDSLCEIDDKINEILNNWYY